MFYSRPVAWNRFDVFDRTPKQCAHTLRASESERVREEASERARERVREEASERERERVRETASERAREGGNGSEQARERERESLATVAALLAWPASRCLGKTELLLTCHLGQLALRCAMRPPLRDGGGAGTCRR